MGLVTKEYDAHMISCSDDGTVKMWDIVEERDNRLAAPRFQRCPAIIQCVLPMKDLALTLSAKNISVWNIMLGRLDLSKKRPFGNENIICAAVDTESSNYLSVVLAADGKVGILSGKQSNDIQLDLKFIDTQIGRCQSKASWILIEKSYCVTINQTSCAIIDVTKLVTEQRFDFADELPQTEVYDACMTQSKEILLLLKGNYLAIYGGAAGKLNHLIKLHSASLKVSFYGDVKHVRYMKAKRAAFVVFEKGIGVWDVENAKLTGSASIDMSESRDIQLAANDNKVLSFSKLGFQVLDTFAFQITCFESCDTSINSAVITPDGNYVVYVTDSRNVRVLRLPGGERIASYIMYTKIHSLAVSDDSWYVMLGTEDRRLFVLMIVDSGNIQHSNRIKHVRENQQILQEQNKVLAVKYGQMADLATNECDDLSDVEDEDGEMLNVESDDSSDADDEEDILQSSGSKKQVPAKVKKKQKDPTKKPNSQDVNKSSRACTVI